KTYQYGFSFDPVAGVAACRGEHGDAAGLLVHLEGAQGAYEAGQGGRLLRLEAMGPAAEMAKLKPRLGPLGCEFFVTEWAYRNEASAQGMTRAKPKAVQDAKKADAKKAGGAKHGPRPAKKGEARKTQAAPPTKAKAVLTEEQVSDIVKTWKMAAALGAETVGVLLFKQIFDIAPQALQLFAFKDEPNLYDSPKLKGHGVKVVTTVDAVVNSVRDLEALKPTLQDLGLRHVGYGVLPPHYDVVGKALLRTLKLGLQDAFTKRVEAAWTKLWAFVAKWCTAGNYPEQATAVLTEEQVSVIETTWKQAAALGAETVGVLLFKQIFDIAPQALQLFAFKDEPNLYDSPKLKGHGVKVVTTVDAVVNSVRDLEALKPTLQDLGLRHVGYGVLPPHYDVVGQALLRTLKLGLKDAFTKEVEAAWTKLWAFVAKWCTAGNYPEQDIGGVTPKKATAVLTEEQVSVIETTWKQAAALGAETVGVLLFKQIFDIAPQALQLFAFKDEPNLYDSPKLKGHGVKVVTTVDAVVSGVRDLEALKPTLQDLGLRHVGYGVLPPHYDVVGQALLRTLKLGWPGAPEDPEARAEGRIHEGGRGRLDQDPEARAEGRIHEGGRGRLDQPLGLCGRLGQTLGLCGQVVHGRQLPRAGYRGCESEEGGKGEGEACPNRGRLRRGGREGEEGRKESTKEGVHDGSRGQGDGEGADSCCQGRQDGRGGGADPAGRGCQPVGHRRQHRPALGRAGGLAGHRERAARRRRRPSGAGEARRVGQHAPAPRRAGRAPGGRRG
ncbi:unnamed protein product, partial [Prorocentrum cordatum]